MALADRRPLGIQVSAIPASPSFNPKTLSVSSNSSINPSSPAPLNSSNSSKSSVQNFQDDDLINPLTPEKSLSPGDLSPTSRSISPDSLMNNDPTSLHTSISKKSYSRGSTPPSTSSTPPSTLPQPSQAQIQAQQPLKKVKNSSRAPIATGISTTIPVTGEKPRPEQKNDPSLEDDVLYAIFVILYEKDPQGAGMTVKQICDILVEQHPEMANLSTKTSNLVSAKLNAYVKRVEKGENNLKYALSRDWADASPKRMVYVYRGLLAEDFHVHVKKLMEIQKQEQNLGHSDTDPSASPKSESVGPSMKASKFPELASLNDSLEAGKQASLAKPRRQTMYDLGITKNTFLDAPIDKSNLFVPYSSAPVTASLTESNSNHKSTDDDANEAKESDLEFEDFEVFDDDEEDGDLVAGTNDLYIEHMRKNGKRSKSLSYLSLNKKSKILTAAAAAPRASRAPSSHSPNAAAAAAALHAAALKAISSQSSFMSTLKTDSDSPSNKKWLNVIRSGFLSQDIAAPEDISLSDLDKFFA